MFLERLLKLTVLIHESKICLLSHHNISACAKLCRGIKIEFNSFYRSIEEVKDEMKAPRFDVLIIGFIQFWLKRRELLGKSIAFFFEKPNK